MKVFGPLLLLAAVFPQTLGLRIIGESGPANQLQPADITLLGAHGTGCGFDDYSTGQMTVRNVGGTRHFYILSHSGPNNISVGSIGSGSSSTVFTLSSGIANFTPGMSVHVYRQAVTASHGPAETATISNIAGSVMTVSPALGGTPVSGDYIWSMDYPGFPTLGIIDYTDDGSAWKMPAANPNNFSSCTTIVDPLGANALGWYDDGTPNAPGSGISAAGLYWHEANGLFYLTWYDVYGVSGAGHWNMMAYNPATQARYGPWKPQWTDSDAVVHAGLEGCAFLATDATDSTKILCGTGGTSGIAAAPMGPNNINGIAWPTSSTPSGYTSGTLTAPTRSMYYYATSYDFNGNPIGTARSQRYADTSFGYNWESLQTDGLVANRANNGGYNTWNASVSTNAGLIDFRGSHKQGGLALVSEAGLPGGGATADCTLGAHVWYENDNNGDITVASSSGSFVNGDNFTASPSGAHGTINGYDSSHLWIKFARISGTPLVGDTITDDGNGVHGVANYVKFHDTCFHGCVASTATTGPVVNYSEPHAVLQIFSDTAWDAVRAANGAGDYQVVPTGILDLTSAGAEFAPAGLNGGEIDCCAIDPITPTVFYFVAHRADFRGGITRRSYIYKLQINDTTAPEPTLMGWLWALAPRWMTKPVSAQPSLVTHFQRKD